MINKLHYIFCLSLLVNSFSVFANGGTVSVIDTPYVQQSEQELEYEFIFQHDSQKELDGQFAHKFEYAKALSDRWLVEFGITAEDNSKQSFDITSYELEAKFQLSEQGEYDYDWGIIFEVERESKSNTWEIGSTLIISRDWSRWTGIANLSLIYEKSEKNSEFETIFAGQLKYRYKAIIEPAIEYFKSESTNAIGPSLQGQKKLSGKKTLYWGIGAAFSLDSRQPDTTIRVNIEYEF